MTVLFDEMTKLRHALRSGLGYYRARPQAALNLLGAPSTPTQSAEARIRTQLPRQWQPAH